jgi:hypothetical protein
VNEKGRRSHGKGTERARRVKQNLALLGRVGSSSAKAREQRVVNWRRCRRWTGALFRMAKAVVLRREHFVDNADG